MNLNWHDKFMLHGLVLLVEIFKDAKQANPLSLPSISLRISVSELLVSKKSIIYCMLNLICQRKIYLCINALLAILTKWLEVWLLVIHFTYPHANTLVVGS